MADVGLAWLIGLMGWFGMLSYMQK